MTPALTAALDALRAAQADYDRESAADDVLFRAVCGLATKERTVATIDRMRAAAGDPEARRRAAEVRLESAACALLSAVAGESAGEWLRGRLDYDGTGP